MCVYSDEVQGRRRDKEKDKEKAKPDRKVATIEF